MTYDYIPLIHRIHLQYFNEKQSHQFCQYWSSVTSWYESTKMLEDFWGSKLHHILHQKGCFQNDTDLGFYLSTDGIKVYKSWVEFHNWPILLVHLGLPLSERFKQQNCLFVSSIPGPHRPNDLNSFLVPLIDKFWELQTGIPGVWNEFKKEFFTLKAHICIIGTDMPASETLMQITGRSSYNHCLYCKHVGY